MRDQPIELSEPYFAGQILEILIGEGINNKIYRSQVTQADTRTIVLHVPGFDPLRFVDLLKGTKVQIRISRDGRPHLGSSRLAQHFKNSSPYLVIQSPSTLEPLVRKASLKIETSMKMEYTSREVSPVSEAGNCRDKGNGKLYIHDMPEPFDVGTLLCLNTIDSGGKSIQVDGCVSRVMRDPENPTRYAMHLRVNALDRNQKEHILSAVLNPPDPLYPEGGGVSEEDE